MTIFYKVNLRVCRKVCAHVMIGIASENVFEKRLFFILGGITNSKFCFVLPTK